MSHICMHIAKRMIGSCHTYQWAMSHIKKIMSQIWMNHGTHMNESCHTCESVMPHVWNSHANNKQRKRKRTQQSHNQYTHFHTCNMPHLCLCRDSPSHMTRLIRVCTCMFDHVREQACPKKRYCRSWFRMERSLFFPVSLWHTNAISLLLVMICDKEIILSLFLSLWIAFLSLTCFLSLALACARDLSLALSDSLSLTHTLYIYIHTQTHVNICIYICIYTNIYMCEYIHV